MAYSKQHFELVAMVIKGRLPNYMGTEWKLCATLAKDFAKIFKDKNFRFNCSTFLKACGIPSNSLI